IGNRCIGIGRNNAMRTNQLVTLSVAIVMGAGAVYLSRSWLDSQISAAAARPPAGHIVVAAKALEYGTPLSADGVNEIPWYTHALPDGAFASKDDLLRDGRRIVLSPVQRGEPILQSKITGPGQRASLAALLDEGKRAVTVQVDDVR